MKKPRAVILALAVVLVALMAWPAVAQAETTDLVSVSSTGTQGNDDSTMPSISADGSTVAFVSRATDLAAGDAPAYSDIFVRDLLTGATQLVSVGWDGSPANGDSDSPSINGDGTIVAFTSTATNLVQVPEGFQWFESPYDLPSTPYANVFVRYLAGEFKGTTELVSVSTDGSGGANNRTEMPAISANGSYVAFDSPADNLVAVDTNGTVNDVFVRDLKAKTTELVSVDSNKVQADDDGSGEPSINADGSIVAFTSYAELSPADTDDGLSDVYVRDRNAGVTELVSVDGSGIVSQSNNMWSSINADGSVVAFMSDAYVPPPATNGTTAVSGTDAVAGSPSTEGPDVFVRDRSKGVTELVSVSGGGVGSDNVNVAPSINADGSIVAFMSAPLASFVLSTAAPVAGATTVVSPFLRDGWDIFVRDRKTGVTKLLSVGWDGSPSNGDSYEPSISGDGSRVAFSSEATNLVPWDVNGFEDVFVATYTRTWGFPIRYEQTDPRIVYTGNWETGENKSHSGGSNYYSNDPEATITITFKGTRLDWIAAMGPLMGKALVSIDGGEPVLVDLFSETDLFQQLVWSTGELEYGVHTITITFPEGSDYQEGKGINVDAFDVWGKLLKTE
jgi:Tol biopolymer transport system component